MDVKLGFVKLNRCASQDGHGKARTKQRKKTVQGQIKDFPTGQSFVLALCIHWIEKMSMAIVFITSMLFLCLFSMMTAKKVSSPFALDSDLLIQSVAAIISTQEQICLFLHTYQSFLSCLVHCTHKTDILHRISRAGTHVL